MKIGLPIAISFLLSLAMGCSDTYKRQPNIVLIMADDVGFSDIGCYGSEIKTPSLDKLAQEGLRFQTFYNMAKCDPSRATLLTGLYFGGNGAVHIAELAKQAGYTTLMSGKEHFSGWFPDYCHADRVFDHSFTFWATTEYFIPPRGEFARPFFLDGEKISASQIQYQQSPPYKTDFITDYALTWLEDLYDSDEPFFLYLPYHAAHYPLQARPKDIAKYRGQYLKGWDTLREERFNRLLQLGLLPKNAILSPPEGNLNRFRGPLVPDYVNYYPWESLSASKQDSLDLEMAVFAAMVDRMDQNIGRIISSLEQNGKLDNTLIMFMTDNGSCPYYQNNIKNVPPGPANSFWSLRSSWANLGNTPFRQFKQFGLEGGSHSPFIAYWNGVIEPNTITTQIGHIVDIAPTLLDIFNLSYPDSIEGYSTLPLQGYSLLPVFEGDEREEPGFFISGLNKFRMFRKGDYKITRINGGPWELYHMVNDPTELNNLADSIPGLVREMAAEYEHIQTGWKNPL